MEKSQIIYNDIRKIKEIIYNNALEIEEHNEVAIGLKEFRLIEMLLDGILALEGKE